MKKTIVIGFIGIIALVGFLAFQTKRENRILHSNQLSDRAKQYLEQKKETNNSNWRNVEMNAKRPDVNSSEIIDVDTCFSFTAPFPVANMSKQGECSYSIHTAAPRGRIVAFQRSVEAQSVDDIADVIMRRNNKDEYEEGSIQSKNAVFITFKKSGASTYEKTAFNADQGLTAITLTASTNENLDKKFDKMIESVEIKN